MLGRTATLLTALALTAGACSSGDGVTSTDDEPVGTPALVVDDDGDSPEDPNNTDDTGDTPTDDPGDSDDPSDADDNAGLDESPAFIPEPLEWNEYDDAVDVAVLEVPIDYGDPSSGTFELFLARHRATDPDARIGSLLVNPGGPGFSGAVIALYPSLYFEDEMLERFDIIGWDPRGTGESDPPIDCIDDYDTYFTAPDYTPETEQERLEAVALAERFAQECVSKNAAIIDHIGTNSSARDIDTIRRALGEDQISYFGFSYGSELGGAWVTMFPDTVRAAVFDGAVDPNSDGFDSTIQQQRGFQGTLETFLAQCNDDADCEFRDGGDATQAFIDIMSELDSNPLTVDPDRPPVNRDVGLSATFEALYVEWRWPMLRDALAAAADGDGAGLLELHDSYFGRLPDGSYGNELEAFQVINCADSTERLTVEEVDARMPELVEAAPLLNPADSIGGYFCTFFPPSADPRIDITGAGAGPILVIGTTGDPATPFDSTVRMSDTLEDGRLVIVEADEHTGYGLNQCVNDVVHAYLFDLEAPADETNCG